MYRKGSSDPYMHCITSSTRQDENSMRRIPSLRAKDDIPSLKAKDVYTYIYINIYTYMYRRRGGHSNLPGLALLDPKPHSLSHLLHPLGSGLN